MAVVWAIRNPHYFLPSDLKISWEKMNFSVQKTDWLTWNLNWEVLQLHIEKKDPMLDLPVDRFALQSKLSFFAKGPWLSFSDITMHANEASRIKLNDSPPTKEAELNPFERFQSYLGYLRTGARWTSVEKINIDIPSFTILNPQDKSVAHISTLISKPFADDADLLAVKFSVAAAGHNISGQMWLNVNEIDKPSPFVSMRFESKGPSLNIQGDLKGIYQNLEPRLHGHFEVRYRQGKRIIKTHSDLSLAMRASGAQLRLGSSIENLPGPLPKLNDLKFDLEVPFDSGLAWSKKPARFKLVAPVNLFFVDRNMRPPLERSCHCKIPEKLMVNYEGRAWIEPMLDGRTEKTSVVESRLSVENIDNKLLHIDLNADVKVEKEKEQWLLEPRMDSRLTVRSFQGLRQFLDARNVMIPAPFDVLDGQIELSARSSVDHDDKMIRSAVEVKVDLASKRQRVLAESTIKLDLSRNFKSLDIFVHSLLKEIRLELPPLDPIRGIPSVQTDPRLVFKNEKPTTRSNFKLHLFFDVETARPGSIQLLSKLAVPYAPLSLDINTSSKGASAGFVRLEPFDISYLRRRVHVERLQISLNENNNDDFPLSGRFQIDQTAYKVFIDLGGTVDSPIVTLSSEPFLPRADIISVLLFDRVNDQLVSTDADTAGSFDAALADRAIGLFGLWAFATTPIRSFYYNPVTKVYTATVQLADGLTAGVGTNWERAAHLEVRKRVSRRWVLTASWSPNEDRSQVGKLVLQWEKRF